MSEEAGPGLLARDRERIEQVARGLKLDRRGFYALVCAPDLLPAALAYLGDMSGRYVPEPSRIEDGSAMEACLRAISKASRSDFACITVRGEASEVWRTLNWHREKLAEGGRVILWLDSVLALQAFREHAPDAYSFRQAVLVLEGERRAFPPGDWEEGEPQEIRAARVLWELGRTPEDRAEAGIKLVGALWEKSRAAEAREVAEEALRLIPREKYPRARECTTRLKHYDFLKSIYASDWRSTLAFRACKLGLQEIHEDTVDRLEGLQLSLTLSASAKSPLGADPQVVAAAVRRVHPHMGYAVQFNVCYEAFSSALSRGRCSEAQAFLDKALALPRLETSSRAKCEIWRARKSHDQGRFKLAREAIAAADELFRRTQHSDRIARDLEISLLIDEGELSAAEKVARSIRAYSSTRRDRIEFKRGNTGDFIASLESVIAEDIEALRDERVFHRCLFLVEHVTEGRDARRFEEADIERVVAIVDGAEKPLLRYANKNPPWYDVLFPTLRGEILSLLPARHEEAIRVAKRGVALAHAHWKQALPRASRILVNALANAGRWDDMRNEIVEAMKYARDADSLYALARIQVFDLSRLLRKDAPQDKVDTALAFLKKTFAEADSPRFEAETWLEYGEPYLPLTTTRIDLIGIVDRIHDVFSDMPMPESAARCMEWLGDIYASRGDKKEAERCYRMALGPLERRGILLRKPLLEGKIAAVKDG